ncbi:hypothetical protein Dimus_037890 [Dionaea muscipula]
MGVHTGDSFTVAPAQTLIDKEYQSLRDYSIAIIREVGVQCDGSNVQFAVNPDDGEVMVIEMNPRVSRSSVITRSALFRFYFIFGPIGFYLKYSDKGILL